MWWSRKKADADRTADLLMELLAVMEDIRDDVRTIRNHAEDAQPVMTDIRDSVDKLADNLADDLEAIREHFAIARIGED